MKIVITVEDPTPEFVELMKPLLDAARWTQYPSAPSDDTVTRGPGDRVTARSGSPGHPVTGSPGHPQDPDRPTDGRTLLGWADRHGLRSDVLRLGRSRRYPGKVVDWSHDQVADVYQVLNSKPPKGSQTWGGAAESGRVRPK